MHTGLLTTESTHKRTMVLNLYESGTKDGRNLLILEFFFSCKLQNFVRICPSESKCCPKSQVKMLWLTEVRK
jgi:hypothetical protein